MKVPVDTFILVHGTFASDAAWVKEDSPLCTALKAAFPESTIETFGWGGDNLQLVREREALRLRTRLLALAGDPEQPSRVAVIAHSHGGNLAIDAIRYEAPIPGLRCIVCLATPFLRYSVLPVEAPFKFVEDFFSLWPFYFIAGYWGHDPFVDLTCVITSTAGHLLATACMLLCVALTVVLNSVVRGGLSLVVRKGMKSPALRVQPVVPVLAVAHPYDEAYGYLKLHNFLTRLPRVIRWAALAVCVFFAVGFFHSVVPGRYCYDVVMKIGWGVLSKPKAALAGIYAGFLIAELWVSVTILSLVVETLWAVIVTAFLHLARGSTVLGSKLATLGLPQLLQIGFGETFRQTWVGSVSVGRLPAGVDGTTLFMVRYPRVGPLLHSAVYAAPEVIRAVVEFVESPSLPVKPIPEPAPAKVRSAPHRRFARIGLWTILLAVVSVVLYPFFKAWHEYRIRTQMDEIARQSARTKALSLRAEIVTGLKISPEEFSDYILAERRAGRLDAASDLAWGKLINALHVPLRSDVTIADFESAEIAGDTIAAFLRMKRAHVTDDLRISPEDLAWTQMHWTLRERRDYAKVLKRAADIVDNGGASSLQAAYKQALQEFAKKGYLPKAIPKTANRR